MNLHAPPPVETASANEPRQTCPNCDYRDLLQCFDVLAADDGNVFCNQCGSEIPIKAEWPE